MRSVNKSMVYHVSFICIVLGFYFWSFEKLNYSYVRMPSYKVNCFKDSCVGGLLAYEVTTVLFIFSDRNSFSRRETIRNTWAKGHKHVYFLVSGIYCIYPLDQRMLGKCEPKDNSQALDQVYIGKQEEINLKLRKEDNVILINTMDIFRNISESISYSNKLVLNKTNSAWILHTEESVDISLQRLEEYLKSELDPTKEIVLIQLLHCDQAKLNSKQNMNCTSDKKSCSLSTLICFFNQVVSRQYIVTFNNIDRPIFQYNHSNYKTAIQISDSSFIQSFQRKNINFMSRSGHDDKPELMVINFASNNEQLNSQDKQILLKENPSLYLNTDRFDIIVKMVYAYFYVFEKRVPSVVEAAYIEHLRVWNNFKEGCGHNKFWFDSKIECSRKQNSSDFISTFHRTIENIKAHGFSANKSRIPVDTNGFVLNGAHRIASSVILSENVSIDHQTYAKHKAFGYKRFRGLGLSERYLRIVMLEWMKIQMKLPDLKSHVSIVSLFSNDKQKDVVVRKIVEKMCSKDNGILYETSACLTKQGMRQLQSHMYGKQSWLETKVKQMTIKFNFTFNALFLFIYKRTQSELIQCKNEIRKYFNDTIFKSTAHIPDTMEENLILAEMILNPNSVQFLNFAKNAEDCKLIASEIASRASKESVRTLPGIFIGRQDIMVDSGAVIGFFGLRKRTDVDLLFLNEIDKSILGIRNTVSIQLHAYKNNSASNERLWGEAHFKTNEVKTPWDLFYDPENYGYCYGIKFVSLKQLIRYKKARDEPIKDNSDVHLIQDFLNSLT